MRTVGIVNSAVDQEWLHLDKKECPKILDWSCSEIHQKAIKGWSSARLSGSSCKVSALAVSTQPTQCPNRDYIPPMSTHMHCTEPTSPLRAHIVTPAHQRGHPVPTAHSSSESPHTVHRAPSPPESPRTAPTVPAAQLICHSLHSTQTKPTRNALQSPSTLHSPLIIYKEYILYMKCFH